MRVGMEEKKMRRIISIGELMSALRLGGLYPAVNGKKIVVTILGDDDDVLVETEEEGVDPLFGF